MHLLLQNRFSLKCTRHSQVFKCRKSNGKVLCVGIRFASILALLTHSILRAPKSRRQLNARVTSFVRLNRSKRFKANKAPVHQTLRQWPRCLMVNNLVVINLATKRARAGKILSFFFFHDARFLFQLVLKENRKYLSSAYGD